MNSFSEPEESIFIPEDLLKNREPKMTGAMRGGNGLNFVLLLHPVCQAFNIFTVVWNQVESTHDQMNLSFADYFGFLND